MKNRPFLRVFMAFVLAVSLVPSNAANAANGLTAGEPADSGIEALVTGKGTVTATEAYGTVTVSATPNEGYYLAQIRYSTDNGASYKQIDLGTTYTFTVTEDQKPNTKVYADFISEVWDGTIDVSWFNKNAYDETDAWALSHPAQVAGLAALVNGLFNDYPVTAILDEGGKEQTYRGKTGNASYLNGTTLVGPDVESSALKSQTLYAEFASTGRITDSQNDYKLGDPVEHKTTIVGDITAIKATLGTTEENPQSKNLKTTSDYYEGEYPFKEKTVRLTADMDFGATKAQNGTWSTDSPRFMPIGGQYCMLPDNGYSKLSSSFCGVLDGGGHTLSNVYCERYSNTEYGDSQSVGIVGRLGVHDDDKAEKRPVNPTVRNIVLESGLMSARRSVGGIVGKIGRTTATFYDGSMGGIVENCINKASVRATDKKGTGGIVGASWNHGIVRNCANFGDVTNQMATPAGGIVGSNENTILNSYNVGQVRAEAANAELSKKSSFSEGVGTRNGDFNHYVDNCYWLEGSATDPEGTGYYGTLKGFGGTGDPKITKFGPNSTVKSVTAASLNGSGGIAWVEGSGKNVLGGTKYPELWYQKNPIQPRTVTIANPDHATIAVKTLYGVGSPVTSGSQVEEGSAIVLTCTPDPGYVLDSFTVGGVTLGEGQNELIVTKDCTVSATLRTSEAATLKLSSEPGVYELTATHTGTIKGEGGAFSKEEDQPIANGATVYEGDVVTLTAKPVAGAVPAESGYAYTDNFDFAVERTGEGTTYLEYFAATSNQASYIVRKGDSPTLSLKAIREKRDSRNWYLHSDTSWYDAKNKKSSYTLSTPAQLAGLSLLVNGASAQLDGEGGDPVNFAGVTVKLARDISLATNDAYKFTPIGCWSDTPFKGTFDGAGHTVTLGDSVSYGRSGLFGVVDGGTVRNLTVAGKATGILMTGGVAGELTGGGRIERCTNKAAIAGTTTTSMIGGGVGGIVGLVSGGTVEACVNEGSVSGASSSTAVVMTSTKVGGIAGDVSASSDAGKSACSIIGCANRGKIAGTSYVGGLVGLAYGQVGSITIRDSYNLGTLVATGWSGGVAGGLRGAGAKVMATIASCYNAGAIVCTDLTRFGGLVGQGLLANYSVSSSRWLNTTALAAIASSSTGTGAINAQSASASQLTAAASALGSAFYLNDVGTDKGFPLIAATLGSAVGVTFHAENGAVLERHAAKANTIPKFTGAAPTKAYDAKSHYTFAGWKFAANSKTELYPSFTAHAHSYTDTVEAAATYANTGSMRHTCACGHSYLSDIPVKQLTAKVKLNKKKTKSSKARKLTVTWTKLTGVNGYQVRYKLGSKTKYKLVSGAKKKSVTLKKLKRKKRYVVSVRAYVKEGSRYFYGPWSATKKVKVK